MAEHVSQQVMDGYEVSTDRRQRRSQQQSEALRLQLEYVKQRLSLSAIVLCDDLGVLVASGGQDQLVESLANQAPWLVATPEWEIHNAITYLWEEFPGLKKGHIALRPIQIECADGSTMILAGVGNSRHLDEWVDHAAVGVRRIIRTLN